MLATISHIMLYKRKTYSKKELREYEEWVEKNRVRKPTQAQLDSDSRKFFSSQASFRISRDRTSHILSKDTPGGGTPLSQAPQYTGVAVIGVATMHKSNAVPVFSEKEAKELSSMRR